MAWTLGGKGDDRAQPIYEPVSLSGLGAIPAKITWELSCSSYADRSTALTAMTATMNSDAT